MNKTSNYQLNQWERDDRVLMEDFNADNAKIDAVLTRLEAAAAMIPKIYIGSYVGTENVSAVTTTTLTLPFEAKLLIVTGEASNASSGYFIRGASMGMINWCGGSVSNLAVSVTWNGCTVSWYADRELTGLHLNTQGVTYHYLALG